MQKVKKYRSKALLFFEHMKAATGVAPHQDVLAGVDDVNGAHRAEAVHVAEGVQQLPGVLEDLDLSGLCHAAHQEAVLLLGVPDGPEAAQPAACVVVVSAGEEEHSSS